MKLLALAGALRLWPLLRQLALASAGALLFCQALAGAESRDPQPVERCIASIYTVESNFGTKTASGIPFRDESLTAAHKSIAFGTRVRVTHRKSGRSVIVEITDRGPFIRGRCIDLSPVAARTIGFGDGLAPVIVAVLK